MSASEYLFYDIPLNNLLFLSEKRKQKISEYSHILLSCPLPYPDLVRKDSKVFIFTHSDVSYINQYALDSGYIPVALNEVTVGKFGAKNVCCRQLLNYLPLETSGNRKKYDDSKIEMLYCNRISFDKNVPMLLLALRFLLDNYGYLNRVKLTLLAGGAEYSVIEYMTIKAAIRKLGLDGHVELLTSQRNVKEFYLNHDFCILSSVSEGCSYGLLEAINYEIPIVTTDIAPNIEVTERCMPVFHLNNIRDRSVNSFCINNYNDYLHDIGYIDNNKISESSETIFIFERLYNREITENNPNFSELKPSAYVPYLLPDITEQLLEQEYIEYIKKWDLYENLIILKPEDQRAVLDKKINQLKSDLNPYMDYWIHQNSVFESGAQSMAAAMHDMMCNHQLYKQNVTSLKSAITKKYYSVEANRIELYTLLFGDQFIFE